MSPIFYDDGEEHQFLLTTTFIKKLYDIYNIIYDKSTQCRNTDNLANDALGD